jgi:acid phosphatase family membrane protein YuiD
MSAKSVKTMFCKLKHECSISSPFFSISEIKEQFEKGFVLIHEDCVGCKIYAQQQASIIFQLLSENYRLKEELSKKTKVSVREVIDDLTALRNFSRLL